jgi:predicted PilT family ATPase
MPVKEVKQKEREDRRQLRWRLIETSKYFEFLFFTPTKTVEIIIDKVLISKLPVQKGKSLKIMKRSALGKEIKHAFRNRLQIKFA